jgi:hypothetical protein
MEAAHDRQADVFVGSVGSNLTTMSTPFSPHDSMIWPIYGAALVGIDTTALRSASSLNPGVTSVRSERSFSRPDLASSAVVSPAIVIFTNRSERLNSVKNMVASA